MDSEWVRVTSRDGEIVFISNLEVYTKASKEGGKDEGWSYEPVHVLTQDELDAMLKDAYDRSDHG
jgi:hypothetical protein